MSRIIFDIGGTNMRVARAAGTTFEGEVKIDTPQAPEEAFATLAKLVESAADSDGVEVIAGGVAGVVNAEGDVIASPNLSAWQGMRLGERLAERFSVPVHIENDASMAALGEAQYGAGKGAGIVAYLGVGTGVGGARVVDGALDRRAQGFEPGHQIVDAASGGTLESLVGGGALGFRYGMAPASLPRSAYDAALPALAAGVWNAIVLWSPDVVVLGGSLMSEENGFRVADVKNEVEKVRRVLPALPRIARAALGDASGLYGALARLGN
ncbi:MAG TPA: ROK family protein [Candidatus Paceibacterota bacterium]|nr:ROK family protein [Candidatus Paceibacterota bacterium]